MLQEDQVPKGHWMVSPKNAFILAYAGSPTWKPSKFLLPLPKGSAHPVNPVPTGCSHPKSQSHADLSALELLTQVFPDKTCLSSSIIKDRIQVPFTPSLHRPAPSCWGVVPWWKLGKPLLYL